MELGRNRKAMYKAMGSMGSVPHFGYVHSLDLTNLLPLMKAANPVKPPKPSYLASDVPSSLVQNTTAANGEEREKTSILAFLVKAMALALDEHPIMRSRVKERDGERWLEVADDAAIGIAVSDPKAGLVTPSLPPFDPRNSVGSINQALTQLRKTATRPSAPPNITISSVGPLGEAKSAMPVLPPGGGVAIAAVGRAAWENELVARNGRNGDGKVWDMTLDEVAGMGTKPVLKCNVGWSGDHRVLEGAELIAFTETWKRYVEEPWRWVNI
jgi:2-oxoisovalerate dehydrogenase E2 component (dihydrolipoyl transacylase)